MNIYDTFTGEKRAFVPRHPGKVSLYVCGITVYDQCHIGHARVSVAFDVIARYLEAKGFTVEYVRNITDIDDKIIARANERGQEVGELTGTYIQQMHEDFDALGIQRPSQEPKATAHMQDIVAMIEALGQKGYAYVAENGDVYYDVEKFDRYGQLSHQSLDALQSGVRVAVEAQKKSPLDFVLWKKAKEGEPSWDSPWGPGRPGWHIECSAMSTKCLGHHFDIHGGGHDLLFPHHENERAQSEAATGEPFVNYWMHVGFVQVDKEKMSKSLGNFFTIRDVLKSTPAEVVRYFLMASHYRSQVNYSQENLNSAGEALARLYGALRGLKPGMPPEHSPEREAFHAAMDDDFNTPQALSVLFEIAREIHKAKEQELTKASELAGLLLELGGLLGILQDSPEAFFQGGSEQAQAIEAKIAERNAARAAKNWALADEIRDTLAKEGIVLEDVQGKTIWRKGNL